MEIVQMKSNDGNRIIDVHCLTAEESEKFQALNKLRIASLYQKRAKRACYIFCGTILTLIAIAVLLFVLL